MAHAHVNSWRQTYRGVMEDATLDDPTLIGAREQFWARVLTDSEWRGSRVSVAESEGRIVGLAMSGPTREPDAPGDAQLYVLYVDLAFHGTGAGAALLEAVLHLHEAAVLWVVEANLRARAFYRKQGFVPDGHCRTEAGISEIRLSRRRDSH